MAAYFEKGKKDLVNFCIDGKVICSLIEFDYDGIPPQVFVAIEAAYRYGVEQGKHLKAKEILAACGLAFKEDKNARK